MTNLEIYGRMMREVTQGGGVGTGCRGGLKDLLTCCECGGRPVPQRNGATQRY